MEDSVSAFIVGTCRMLRKSYTDLYQNIRYQSIASHLMYTIGCGSTAEFYIQPLRSGIGDVDILCVKPYRLALTDIDLVLSHAVRAITDTADCFLVEPYHGYPAFVKLRQLGKIRYNWDRKMLVFVQLVEEKRHLMKTTDLSEEEQGCTHGPAVKHAESIYSPPHDLVESIAYPQWPNQAKKWPYRQRKYGWPTTATIQEIVQNGCHIVFAKHRSCKNDLHQFRLSFSVAEVILLQSWTPIQQIVYHMLRFFAKRELINADCPKEDEVLCTYHFKTLMLWSCEETLPEWWTSTPVLEICRNLLHKLAKWLREKTCPHYFIPQANLFHETVNEDINEEVTERVIRFCSLQNLSLWFVQHYVHPSFLQVINERCSCALSKNVSQFMLHICKKMETSKTKSIDLYFSRGFADLSGCVWSVVNKGCRLGLHNAVKYYLRPGSILSDPDDVLPSIEVESCFEFYASTLLILYSVYLIECTENEYDSELLVYLIKTVCIKPKFITSPCHIFPQPWKQDLDKSQLYFLKSSDLMENLTESTNDLESQIVSHISKGLLRKALSFKDSKTISISSATLTYLASLHFAASEYQNSVDICSKVISNHMSVVGEKETLNAGCLYYIDDIVTVIGFYVLFRRIKDNFPHKGRQFLLDLRLTPAVFALYLIITSTEITRRQYGFVYNVRAPTLPLDHILMNVVKNRMSLRMSKKRDYSVRVYQRTDPIKTEEELNDSSQRNKDRAIQLLMDYSLEKMSSFYATICKDFHIKCNTVDCYRAAYLYKSRIYPEVLLSCEKILDEPDLQSDLKLLAFANVMVFPPLDIYFDRDIQCLLGFHTLFHCLLVSIKDMPKIEENTALTIENFFAQKILSSKPWIPSMIFSDAYSVTYNYFLGRFFLARYLKVRCLIDCNHSLSEVMNEFKKLKAALPFEELVRRILQQKLYKLQKVVDEKYFTS